MSDSIKMCLIVCATIALTIFSCTFLITGCAEKSYRIPANGLATPQ